MKSFLLCLIPLLFWGYFSKANDTTVVSAHTRVNMVWNEGYEELVNFPAAGKKYRKMLMHFSLGCASSGCSDWDYTVRIDAKKASKTGDTVLYELGRLITPYGGYMARSQQGFSNKWSITHTYDVTDFAPILNGDVPIRVFYDGWSSGFSATVWFELIEGQPVREVLGIENVYRVSDAYKTADEFERLSLPERTVKLADGTKDARFKVLVTGHGFDNSNNCAEFCERNYQLKVNNQNVAKVKMWRDDCGSNPIWPQAGTWVFNRANWCPGDKVGVFDHELKPFLKFDTDNTIDLNIEKYTWSGTQAPSYILSAQLVSYGDISAKNDAAMESIITPNQKSNVRFNTTCTNARIAIRNNGSNVLKKVKIEYGVQGTGQTSVYVWYGNLNFGEVAEVELPSSNWGTWTGVDNVFWVKLSEPNSETDEYSKDNSMAVNFKLAPVLDNTLNFFIRSNNKFSENSLEIIHLNTGEKVLSVAKMANEVYDIPLNYPPGCYRLLIKDSNGDGFYWPFNGAAGRGYVQLRKDGNPIRSFNPDFGNEFIYDFTLNYTLGQTASPFASLVLSESGQTLSTGDNLFFGIMEVGKPLTKSLKLENKGLATLKLIESSILDDKRFKFSKKLPATLAAGESFEVDIVFSSGKEKDARAKLVFQSNDALMNSFELDLSALTKLTEISVDLPQQILLYPNPTQDRVRVTVPQASEKGSIEVYDLMGKKVEATILTFDAQNYEIDLSALPSGVYIIKWQNKWQSANSKVIKNKL